jgi:ribosomal-protein-alanine N-acetyltransferase
MLAFRFSKFIPVDSMSDPPCWLTTERLALRRFTAADLNWLATLYSDRDVTRYLGGVKDRARTEELLHTRILRYYDEHPGLGIWMTVESATGMSVGFHVLNHIRGESIIQVGFTLAKSAWGKGYATEMAAALLAYGFLDLKLPRIVGIASLQNHASQRVLTKIGLLRKGERAFAHPDYASQGAMAWFERDATDWQAGHASPPA